MATSFSEFLRAPIAAFGLVLGFCVGVYLLYLSIIAAFAVLIQLLV